MMAHKQVLHELLKEDQEPFHLKSYIADRQSRLKNPSSATTLQLRKRRPLVPETSAKRSNLCKHACFFSFQNSPDVRKSPFLEFPSPAKSPCKSPNRAVFLHIPSRTAALLLEAAMRIQKQQQAKPKSQSKNVGFGLLGSFLKRLKDRSKNKRRAIGDNDVKVSSGGNATTVEEKVEETIRISCSCSNRRLSSADWTENNEDPWILRHPLAVVVQNARRRLIPILVLVNHAFAQVLSDSLYTEARHPPAAARRSSVLRQLRPVAT
ncbi:UNVERIFIED_CONTAM: hypothetical protein Sradi_5899600 [Sesamum radiatum]|uniref:Uncharacterized protein n=1 Tax=Sesamum radiatum TaxID=300843 RepID=A0AAW2KSQ1_SESRA